MTSTHFNQTTLTVEESITVQLTCADNSRLAKQVKNKHEVSRTVILPPKVCVLYFIVLYSRLGRKCEIVYCQNRPPLPTYDA